MSSAGPAAPFQFRHDVGPPIQSNDGRIGEDLYRGLSLRRATLPSPRRPLVRRLLLLRRLPQGLGFAVRNSCPVCGGLVFGGEVGKSDSFSIYAGSLDDPASFHPTVAIFTRDRPAWALIPPELRAFETLPG
jgi:hypothetical protein